MQTKRKFTNATFTKRVDHEAGRHRAPKAHREPAVCGTCGARYENRRWVAAGDVLSNLGTLSTASPATIVCPACKQIENGVPSGFLTVSGRFFGEYREQIERLLKNEVERTQHDNPLARIMRWEMGEGALVIATTTEHLAQRLGTALEKAFKGKTHFDFSHENKLARVSWHRD
jgi:hypothetical protein